MLIFVFQCLFFFLHLSISSVIATTAYKPNEYFLLNCGSPSNITFNGRNWDTDEHLKFLPLNMADVSSAATALEQGSSVERVPYMTARIFHSQFTYSFPLSPGPKFLRLYFYQVAYSGLNNSQAFFTVTANGYTLLSNFSGFPTGSYQEASLVREFIVNVKDNQILYLTFSPSSKSYSFVNGIEIVSMPDDLYLKEKSPKSVDQQSLFDFDKLGTAFETVYRLNVGGQYVPLLQDTGMFRQWSPDDNFIFGAQHGNPLYYNVTIKYTKETPAYTAPEIVYATARAMGQYAEKYHLTWIFTVDPGFFYLLRLHFCEIQPSIINDQNQRVFTILINNKTAESAFDVMYHSNGNGIPIFREYVLLVPQPSDGRPSKQDLWLALFPSLDSKPEYTDAILNGLEIFKLNGSDGNLAGPNPKLLVNPNTLTPNPNGTKKKSSKSLTTINAVIGGVVGAAASLLILVFLFFQRRRIWKDLEIGASKSSWIPLSISSSSTKSSGSFPYLCRSFLLEELKSVTADFDDSIVIGRGGFGNVYKGYVDNGATSVAVKRLNPSSKQGDREFRTEIEMLSKLRHRHLVSLIGYCDEQGEMILVYDYMANGTLRDHLYKTKNPPLPWKQRLQICIGAAKGLDYLHTGAEQNIIHRDVKSTNILLDKKWVAKVSDFGLSRIGPSDEDQSHVSTVVKGSFGYMDPEYYKKKQLTDKSDVYSFGVVLLEVLCARPPVMPKLRKGKASLVDWASVCFREGTIDDIVDRNVRGCIAPECLAKYVETALDCLKDRGVERQAMKDVITSLEFALQLQEAAENAGRVASFSSAPNKYGHHQVSSSNDQRNISEIEVDRPTLLTTDETGDFLKFPAMGDYIEGELAKALDAGELSKAHAAS